MISSQDDYKLTNTVRRTIVLKVTTSCNLSCSYCYERVSSSSPSMMPEPWKLIERIGSCVQESRLLFLLHGGEPLLISDESLMLIIEACNKSSVEFGNRVGLSVQTNGTLLTNSWLDIWQSASNLTSYHPISISIDGPKNIHDMYRRHADGSGSFELVKNGIKLLHERQINYGLLTVIARHNVNIPEKIIDTLNNLNCKFVRFLPCYDLDESGQLEEFAISPSEFTSFMLKAFKYWARCAGTAKDKQTGMFIDPLTSIISKMQGLPTPWCEYSKDKCEGFLMVYPDGESFLCDAYIRDNYARVGNVFNLEEKQLRGLILGKGRYQTFAEEKKRLLEDCRECPVFDVCTGACMMHRAIIGKRFPKWLEEYCKAKITLITELRRAISETTE